MNTGRRDEGHCVNGKHEISARYQYKLYKGSVRQLGLSEYINIIKTQLCRSDIHGIWYLKLTGVY